MVREEGIYTNWMWWSWIIGLMAATFFFAPLWRRSRVLTEIEFLQRRYDATPTMVGLRIFKAAYDGLFVNCVVMATVTLAMSKLLAVILGLTPADTFDLPLVGEVPAIVTLLAGARSRRRRLYGAVRALWRRLYRPHPVCAGHDRLHCARRHRLCRPRRSRRDRHQRAARDWGGGAESGLLPRVRPQTCKPPPSPSCSPWAGGFTRRAPAIWSSARLPPVPRRTPSCRSIGSRSAISWCEAGPGSSSASHRSCTSRCWRTRSFPTPP